MIGLAASYSFSFQFMIEVHRLTDQAVRCGGWHGRAACGAGCRVGVGFRIDIEEAAEATLQLRRENLDLDGEVAGMRLLVLHAAWQDR